MRNTAGIEEQLRRAIIDAGMSRYALSKRSGVTQGVISRFVNRSRGITMEIGAKLAAVLGLTLAPATRGRKGR